MKKAAVLLLIIFAGCKLRAHPRDVPELGNSLCSIRLENNHGCLWRYRIRAGHTSLAIQEPSFQVDGKRILARASLIRSLPVIKLRNGVSEYTFRGPLVADRSLELTITFRLSDLSPVVRFKYELHSTGRHTLTKTARCDDLRYFSLPLSAFPEVREVSLSEFNEKYHAYNLEETPIEARYFEDNGSVMGPILEFSHGDEHYLLGYEHGSQSPNRFLQFSLGKGKERRVSLDAVKANYTDGQVVDKNNGYTTIWFEAGGAIGDESRLKGYYRHFVLDDLSENLESRKPYIYYNTWGRQERAHVLSGKYLSTVNLATTLKEIDVCHELGVEVYVIDAGWFIRTGDWDVNTKLFPDTLRQVKRLLDRYGMKLGLWFNPTVAAISSKMLSGNKDFVMARGDEESAPRKVWETEESVDLCLVSPYWEMYADRLVELSKTLGVTYFKWDAIGQYGCDRPGHLHGTRNMSASERAESYAFLLPQYMAKVINKVCKANPAAIFDFDITENGRCMGLEFLSAGKYFIINNGPYFSNFDLGPQWLSSQAATNPNLFFNAGPARGWFTRSALTYDSWIPSILFLTHYVPDEPKSSQSVNLASLILGQNGIWGNIIQTSAAGISYFNEVLGKYKQVREDITSSYPQTIGETGASPEIHEKIDSESGKGAIVIFANTKGDYTYISKNKVSRSLWTSEGVKVSYDAHGRAVIAATFDRADAKILFFGVN